MVKRSIIKTKNDVTLHAQSSKNRKGKGKWNRSRGRGGYESLNARSHHPEVKRFDKSKI